MYSCKTTVREDCVFRRYGAILAFIGALLAIHSAAGIQSTYFNAGSIKEVVDQIPIKHIFSGASASTYADVGIQYGSYTYWLRYRYYQQQVTATSIDSRRVFNQANVAGAVAGSQTDPNSIGKNQNFNSWI